MLADRGARDDADARRRQGPYRGHGSRSSSPRLRAAYANCAVDVGTGDGRLRVSPRVGASRLAGDRDRRARRADGRDRVQGGAQAGARRAPESRPAARRDRGAARRSSRRSPTRSTCCCRGARCSKGSCGATPRSSRGIATLAAPGARVDVTLNGEIWHDSTPARYEHLPVADTRVRRRRRSRRSSRRAGIDLEPARYMTAAEAKALPDHVGAPARPRPSASALRAHRRCAPKRLNY